MHNNNIWTQYINPVPYEEGEVVNSECTSVPDISLLVGGIAFIILLAAIVFLLLIILGKKQKRAKQKANALEGVLLRVRVTSDNEYEIGTAEQMFANLFGVGKKFKFLQKIFKVNPAISFEIVSLPNGIDFYVYTPRKYAALVENQILGSYPSGEVVEVSQHNIFKSNSAVAWAELALSDEAFTPIKTYDDLASDPLANITSAMSKVTDGEGVVLQVVISTPATNWQKNGQKYVLKINNEASDPEKPKVKVSQEKLQAIEKKCSKVGFSVAIRIVATAPTKELAEARIRSVVGAFDQFSNPGINRLKKKDIKKSKMADFIKSFIYRMGPLNDKTVLNVEELATIFHLPNKDVKTPLINWLSFKKAPVDSRVPTTGTWLGTAIYRGVKRPVCIKHKDRRRHMYIIGKTGVGKSWFLQSLVMQDIYAGHGVALLDPHGDVAEWILDRIPPDRVEDVIYFNPGDRERPVGFNIMEAYSESDKHQVVNGFLDLMHKLFDPNNQGIVGPIFERSVRNAMLTAMSEEGSTLVEVVRILTDEDWVKSYWLPKIKDDLVKRFWTDQMAKTDKFHKSEALGYLVSKFDRFVTNELMRHIIGQSKSGFEFREVMDQQKILIINLSQGLIGPENAQFLGLLLIPRLMRAALSRSDIPEDERKDFYLYVDEFQNFSTDAFAKILSEARKYRLNLTVANQYIAQMNEEIRDAVFGNIGTIVSFKVGPDDAEYLEKMFDPIFTAQDLIGLEAINAYVRLLCDDEWPPAFSISTYYNADEKYPKDVKVGALVRQLSRIRYGRDAIEVREEIAKRAQLATKNTGGTPSVPSFPKF